MLGKIVMTPRFWTIVGIILIIALLYKKYVLKTEEFSSPSFIVKLHGICVKDDQDCINATNELKNHFLGWSSQGRQKRLADSGDIGFRTYVTNLPVKRVNKMLAGFRREAQDDSLNFPFVSAYNLQTNQIFDVIKTITEPNLNALVDRIVNELKPPEARAPGTDNLPPPPSSANLVQDSANPVSDSANPVPQPEPEPEPQSAGSERPSDCPACPECPKCLQTVCPSPKECPKCPDEEKKKKKATCVIL